MEFSVQPEILRDILEKAILAPSGDNMQPWRFKVSDEKIHLFILPNPAGHYFEKGHRTLYVSAGAVIENIRVAASFYQQTIGVEYFPDVEDPLWVASITLRPAEACQDHEMLKRHYAALERRCTNRKLFDPQCEIPKEMYGNISQVILGDQSAQLFWIKKENTAYSRLVRMICEADRLRFENRRVHTEFMKCVRFDRQSTEKTRNGLNVQTFEAGKSGPFLLTLLKSWNRLRLLNLLLGFSRLLAGNTKKQMNSSRGVGLIVTSGNGPADYVRGGEAMERVWHEMTLLGLSLQPMMALPVFLIAQAFVSEDVFRGRQKEKVLQMAREFRSLFNLCGQEGLILMFRTGYADPPSARSLRMPLESFLMKIPAESEGKENDLCR